MKSLNIFLAWLLAFSIISSIKAYEPTQDQIREAYNSFVSKFKKSGNKFALTNVDGFWQTAEIAEVFIDAYERFQDEDSKKNMIEVVDSWLNKEGEDWKWNNYNDDIMWACIMLTRTYLHTKNERYLTIAKNNFKTVYDRAWNDKFGGGLIWYQGKTSKNACVNGPGAIAACFLAIAIGDNTYYDKADNMIKWLNEMLVQNGIVLIWIIQIIINIINGFLLIIKEHILVLPKCYMNIIINLNTQKWLKKPQKEQQKQIVF